MHEIRWCGLGTGKSGGGVGSLGAGVGVGDRGSRNSRLSSLHLPLIPTSFAFALHDAVGFLRLLATPFDMHMQEPDFVSV